MWRGHTAWACTAPFVRIDFLLLSFSLFTAHRTALHRPVRVYISIPHHVHLCTYPCPFPTFGVESHLCTSLRLPLHNRYPTPCANDPSFLLANHHDATFLCGRIFPALVVANVTPYGTHTFTFTNPYSHARRYARPRLPYLQDPLSVDSPHIHHCGILIPSRPWVAALVAVSSFSRTDRTVSAGPRQPSAAEAGFTV
jgi:hypothetical protein